MFYGISVGCGDPEDMTLRAVRTLENCTSVFVPRTGGRKSLALEIASKAVDLSGKRIEYLDFPMTRDEDELSAAHDAAAEKVCCTLSEGDCAMICLGDVSLYTTFAYVAERVSRQGFAVKWIPGVSSVTACACAAGIPLALGDEPVHILPGSFGQIDEMLSLSGTKVIMKSGKKAPRLVGQLEERGLLDNAVAVENAGLDGERVMHGSEISGETGYFTVFIVPGEK